MPINPLGLLSDFLISSSLSNTRNNILSTDSTPLKSSVPNFTAQCTKPLVSPALTTKFPFCCSLAVFFGLLTTFLLQKYFPIPLSHPHTSTMGYNIKGGRNRNLNKLHVIFIIVSQPIPVAARFSIWVCGL